MMALKQSARQCIAAFCLSHMSSAYPAMLLAHFVIHLTQAIAGSCSMSMLSCVTNMAPNRIINVYLVRRAMQ